MPVAGSSRPVSFRHRDPALYGPAGGALKLCVLHPDRLLDHRHLHGPSTPSAAPWPSVEVIAAALAAVYIIGMGLISWPQLRRRPVLVRCPPAGSPLVRHGNSAIFARASTLGVLRQPPKSAMLASSATAGTEEEPAAAWSSFDTRMSHYAARTRVPHVGWFFNAGIFPSARSGDAEGEGSSC